MENKKQKIEWTASNESSYLNGRRNANSLLSAKRDARRYVRGELLGNGKITYYYADSDCPILQEDIFNFCTVTTREDF